MTRNQNDRWHRSHAGEEPIGRKAPGNNSKYETKCDEERDSSSQAHNTTHQLRIWRKWSNSADYSQGRRYVSFDLYVKHDLSKQWHRPKIDAETVIYDTWSFRDLVLFSESFELSHSSSQDF
jgi:hypothetical protein